MRTNALKAIKDDIKSVYIQIRELQAEKAALEKAAAELEKLNGKPKLVTVRAPRGTANGKPSEAGERAILEAIREYGGGPAPYAYITEKTREKVAMSGTTLRLTINALAKEGLVRQTNAPATRNQMWGLTRSGNGRVQAELRLHAGEGVIA